MSEWTKQLKNGNTNQEKYRMTFFSNGEVPLFLQEGIKEDFQNNTMENVNLDIMETLNKN